jgi:hypothetical protein
MKKFLTLALAGAMVLGVSGVAFANICAFDPVPAATLLFPFVSYDYLGGDSGATTLFAITNVSAEAQIVHVTLWTDYSDPILDFNILLTGYDVQTINIRDILRDGQLPVTYQYRRSGTTDPRWADGDFAGGTPSADGPVSNNACNTALAGNAALPAPQENGVFADLGLCQDGDPELYGYPISASVLALFENWLKKSQTVDRVYRTCAGEIVDAAQEAWWWGHRNLFDDTWMYITADVVYRCNKDFPDSLAYYPEIPADPTADRFGIAYDNVLIGDVIWLNQAENFSETSNAVHIEADLDIAEVVTESEEDRPTTFYHRYLLNSPVAWQFAGDFREPLGTAWAMRYFNNDDANAHTWIRAFKQSTNWRTIQDLNHWDGAAMNTGGVGHDPIGMGAENRLAYTYYAWDEHENVIFEDIPWSQPGVQTPPNILPLETQEVNVNNFNLVDDFGWMLFIWPYSNIQDGAGRRDQYQTWMGTKFQAFGQYSAAKDAALMANYNCFSDQRLDNITTVMPKLGINYDYVGTFTDTIETYTGYKKSPGRMP